MGLVSERIPQGGKLKKNNSNKLPEKALTIHFSGSPENKNSDIYHWLYNDVIKFNRRRVRKLLSLVDI